jgi:hypothetical protein
MDPSAASCGNFNYKCTHGLVSFFIPPQINLTAAAAAGAQSLPALPQHGAAQHLLALQQQQQHQQAYCHLLT